MSDAACALDETREPAYGDVMSSGPSVTLSVPFDQAVESVRAALAEEGFGVITEIDFQATMKNKLDVDYPPMLILGACNPGFAHEAITISSEVATLVPCNVVLRQTAAGVTVETIDPQMLVEVTGSDDLRPLAADLRTKLDRAFATLKP